MAFKMNKPVIKGSALHQKQKSIVSQARTSADPGLVSMADVLGKSMMPGAIDYSINYNPKLDFSKREKEEKEPKEKKEFKGCTDPLAVNYIARATVDDGNCRYAIPAMEGIEPKDIEQLPIDKPKDEIKRSMPIDDATETTDKFFEAAKRAGIDIQNEEDYEKAARTLIYDENIDDWRERIGTVIAGDLESKIDNRTDEQIKRDEEDKIFQEKLASANYYGVKVNEMTSDGKGGYEPIEGAKHMAYGDTWDAEKGEWRDDATTATYSFPGGKTFKTKEAADKYQEYLDKKEATEKENAAKEERNQLIREAKEHYGVEKLTKSQFESYKRMIDQLNEDEEMYEELYEEDSPDPELEAYIANKPDLQVKTNEKPVIVNNEETIETDKPKPSDFKDKKNPFGGFLSAQAQYRDALKKWYKSQKEDNTVMKKRDDRIFRNAVAGGTLRKNMISKGYIPQSNIK